MMAFFLLMWLLSSTTKGDLKGISQYFQTPLKSAMRDGNGAGNSNSVVTGGGDEISTSPIDQIKQREKRARSHDRDMERRTERLRMEELKHRLEQLVATDERLTPFKNQLHVEITPDGLRIQIIDDANRPMFDIGSAQLKDYMQIVLREFGAVLDEIDRKIVVTGHTDASQYGTADRAYSNWELSLDRANAARRELIAGGLLATRIARVVGLANTSPLDKEDPMSAVNRRISIMVLDKLADERMVSAGGEIEVGDVAGVEKAMQAREAASTAAVADLTEHAPAH